MKLWFYLKVLEVVLSSRVERSGTLPLDTKAARPERNRDRECCSGNS